MQVQPGFGDDNYRDLVSDDSHGRTESSKELASQERQELMDRLSTLAGEEPRKPWQPRDKKSYPGRPRNMNKPGMSRDEQLKKIEALLTIGKLPWSYADAIAKQMRLADKITWVKTDDLYRVITALKKKAQKEGWDLSGERRG
jgi:phage gp16-like protein